MIKKYVFVPLLLASFLAFSGCTNGQGNDLSTTSTSGITNSNTTSTTIPPTNTTPPESTDFSHGRWVAGDSSLFEEQPQGKNAALLDEYSGKSKAEYEVEAEAKGVPLIWAEGTSFSPSGSYALFSSNRNCLDTDGMSVFLKNCETGEENLLLDGADGSSFSVIGWWLDEESAVVQVLKDNIQTYQMCNLNGQTNTVKMDCTFPTVIDFHGDAFVFSDGTGTNIASYGRVSKDGSITGLISFTPDQGILMDECKISPDQRYVAFKVRESYESPNRSVVVWDTISQASVILPTPEVPDASDIAAIDLDWSNATLSVNFAVTISEVEHYMPFTWKAD